MRCMPDGKMYAYTSQFPMSYLWTELRGTGLLDCANCREYAVWNGVCIGYCINCAHTYPKIRGYGFARHLDEESIEEINERNFSDIVDSNDTYLQNISLNKIGDICRTEKYEILFGQVSEIKLAGQWHYKHDGQCEDFSRPAAIMFCSGMSKKHCTQFLISNYFFDCIRWNQPYFRLNKTPSLVTHHQVGICNTCNLYFCTRCSILRHYH